MDSNLLQRLLAMWRVLTLGFIVLPVFPKAEPRVLRDTLALSLAFAAIGVGFMLVEIAQMQRLIFLLGHPTFSLVGRAVRVADFERARQLRQWTAGRRSACRSLAPRRLGALVVVLALVGADHASGR